MARPHTITSIHDATDPAYNRDFAYDDLNRLVTANSGASLWGAGSYAYDAMGNLTSRSLGTAPVDDGTVLSVPGRHLRAKAAVSGVVDQLVFTYNSTTPQIAIATWNGTDHTVSYDAAGNETSYFATRTYSPRNLLATVTDNTGEGTPHTISYGYDARGVRVTRSESPTSSGAANRYFIYSPELQLLAITDDDSQNVWTSAQRSILSAAISPSHYFHYFNGIPVAEWGPPRTPDVTVLSVARHTPFAIGTANYFTFTDHLGTPLLQTDTNGNVVWRAEHEPYGNVWKMRTGSRTDQPLRLPGQDLAMTWEGTEENYNVFRWYRAGWGRYTQADPIGIGGGLNLYAYVGDDPVDASDPLGLYLAKAYGNNWVSAFGAVNHIPLIGAKINKAAGDPNNIIGFCAKCPINKHPANAKLSPTPPWPKGNSSPDSTLLPSGSKPYGAGNVENECGGCSGAFEQMFYANVATHLAIMPSGLKQQQDKYSIEYECVECKKNK